VGQINAKLIASAFSNIKSFTSFFEGKGDILSTLENTDGLGPKVIQSFIDYSSIKLNCLLITLIAHLKTSMASVSVSSFKWLNTVLGHW